MAKSQSLAAQGGVLTQEVQLPAVFSAPQQKIEARKLAPYIVFAHPKRGDEWAKLVSKHGQIAEGDMFLITPDRTYPLPTAKVGWLCGRQYWAETNMAGDQMLRATFQEAPKPFGERVEAVLLVYLEDTIVPANVLFKKTKCPAAKTLSDAFIEAGTPGWGEISSAHKETLVCNQPFMRFFGNMSVVPPRTSKSSGLPYRTTTCNVQPTGVPEWRLLKQFCEDPLSQKALQEAADRFEMQMREVQAKVK